MASDELARLRELLLGLMAKATPRPWSLLCGTVWSAVDTQRESAVIPSSAIAEEDALLVTAAVNALPTLLAAAEERDQWAERYQRAMDSCSELEHEARELRAEVERLRGVVHDAQAACVLSSGLSLLGAKAVEPIASVLARATADAKAREGGGRG